MKAKLGYATAQRSYHCCSAFHILLNFDIDRGISKGEAECGKCTNTCNFFHGYGWPPLPSYYIGYVFPSSKVFWNVFCPIILASRKSCIYSLSLPTYQCMNFQITVEEALHASLCMEGHTWKFTESGEFSKYSQYLQHYCWCTPYALLLTHSIAFRPQFLIQRCPNLQKWTHILPSPWASPTCCQSQRIPCLALHSEVSPISHSWSWIDEPIHCLGTVGTWSVVLWSSVSRLHGLVLLVKTGLCTPLMTFQSTFKIIL